MKKYTAFIHTDDGRGKLAINVMEFDFGESETILHVYRPDDSEVWSGTFQQLIEKLEAKE